LLETVTVHGGERVLNIRLRSARGRVALLLAVAAAAVAIGCVTTSADTRAHGSATPDTRARTSITAGTAAVAERQARASATPQVLPPPEDLSTVTFYTQSGEQPQLHVDIADTLQKQETGLMNVSPLPDDEGEIFIFDGYTTTPFYMKDTEIPLSIAWIDEDGIIVDIQDMEAETTDLHYPAKPYRYAIEANQGWYAQNGVQVGDYVDVTEAYAASPVYGQPQAEPTATPEQ
jgi:uncharacterized membrane protein (UPF0127 family)